MTITLPHDIEAHLKKEAGRLGLDPNEYAAWLIQRGLTAANPNQAALDLLAKWDAEEATDDPEELARRNREFEEFTEAMNRNRREMEGPDTRKIYP